MLSVPVLFACALAVPLEPPLFAQLLRSADDCAAGGCEVFLNRRGFSRSRQAKAFPQEKAHIPLPQPKKALVDSTKKDGTTSADMIPMIRSEIVGDDGGCHENTRDTLKRMDQIFR